MVQIDVRRIPLVGDDIYQVGQVLQIITQPCTPRPWIAVTAFFVFSPILIWAIAKPDPIDDYYDRIGRRHRRRRRRRFRILDFYRAPPVPEAGLYRIMWRAGDFAQRIGLVFLIADQASDFLLNWTSMAYEFSGCPESNPSQGWFEGEGRFLWTTPVVHSQTLLGDDHGASGTATATDGLVTLNSTGPKSITATFTGRASPAFGKQPEWRRCYIKEQFTTLPTVEHEMELVGGNAAEATFEGTVIHWGNTVEFSDYSVVLETGPGTYRQVNLGLTAVSRPPIEPDPDP